MSPNQAFKVIVVGGGVAGLSLVNMLEKSNIDYLLLEAYDEIAPPTGAGIGLMPNGCFILDQLGLYDAVRETAENGEIENSHIRASNGKSLISLKHMMYHQEKRHGYPMLFFDRQWFLKVLYDQLKYKDRIHPKSRVHRINPTKGGVEVTTKDGQSYTGDIVIGADGVHSDIRQEMRRVAEGIDPKYFDPKEEDGVPCYYKCSFGIAQHVEGWPGGEQGFTTGRGSSFLVVSGPGGRVYWFLFVQLPAAKYGKEIPKYSKEDEALFVKEHQSLKIKENLTFGQVYAKRLTSTLTPLHEIVYKKWFFGRIFLMGDSAHKPNPIGGMGANAAIETAAELMNALLDLKAKRQSGLDSLNARDIEAVFGRVQSARYQRAGQTISSSHELQSLNSYENPMLASLVWRVLAPLAGSYNFFRELSNRIVGASRLKHLDLPSRPHALPYDHELPAKPLGVLPRRIVGALFSFGMILLFYTASNAMNISFDELGTWGGLTPLSRNWLGSNVANDILNALTSLLSFPTLSPDPAPRVQLIYFLTHMISPLLIYTIEGYRIGRNGSLLSLPIIFMIGMQVLGFCKLAPLYALLSALQSDQNPVDRTVRVHVAKALVPALVAAFIIPNILMFAPTPNETRAQDFGALFQLSPPLFSLATALLASALHLYTRLTSTPQSATEKARHAEWYSTADAPLLKNAYALAFVAQATTHLATLAYISLSDHPALSVQRVFFDLPSPFATAAAWTTAVAPSTAEKVFVILKFDLDLTVAAIVAQNLYAVWELRRQGYVATWTAVKAGLAVLVGQVLLGSGATWAALWSWREDVLLGLSVSGSHGGRESAARPVANGKVEG